ncbi:hypothetical protein F5X99DRAFT_425512 [Biscogniauxia marginata]|nr:hypothetical protein F5X99DRAFT_425512 [Biscogniauxia marginata]
MAKVTDNTNATTRHQPRRTARDGRKDTPKTGGITKTGPTKAGISKPKARTARSKAKDKLKATLMKKVDARDPDDAWIEQSRLLGTSTTPVSPKPPRLRKGGRRGRKTPSPKAEKKFMDDIFEQDDDAADQLQRGDRWIPDMELRGRPAQRPPHIPHQLWISYCLLDEHIYRLSLTPDEVLALPLMDDVYTYQHGGPEPICPPGFRWDSHRQLVPEDAGEEDE